MKRIQSACLNQTIHFQLKDGVGRDFAVKEVQKEYENYKKMLSRNCTQHKIVDEKTNDDGSIIIKVKKQVNNYDIGEYLNDQVN